MIHYWGTPSGGGGTEASRFLAGRHALIPHFRRDDLGVAAEVCQSFIFDNSAFTVWKQGGQLDIVGYTKWVEEWHRHPSLDWALIPDSIEGKEDDNDALIRDWPAHLKRKGVPVWHLHESLERLDRLVAEWPTVALGSSGEWPNPGANKWWDRMGEVMAVACDELGRPRARLHGLRMLDPAIFRRLPLSSADSTNAAINSGSVERFGMYVPPSRSQRADVIAARIEQYHSAPTWLPKPTQQRLSL